MPKKRKTKPETPPEDLLQDICDIVMEASDEFGNDPEFYRAVTVRVTALLLRHRSKYLPPEWK